MASMVIWISAIALLAWLCFRIPVVGAAVLFYLGGFMFFAAWIGYAMTAGRDSGVYRCLFIAALLWLGGALRLRYR
jgi:hypothetical protein